MFKTKNIIFYKLGKNQGFSQNWASQNSKTGVYGKAELLRLVLWYAKVYYVDHRFKGDEFKELKASGRLPFG